MQFKTEKEPHRTVSDKATLDKLTAIRKTMNADVQGMARAAAHAIEGRGGFTVTFPEGMQGDPLVEYERIEICPATMRAWLEHSRSYVATVEDMCKLLGVTEKTV